MAVMHHRLFWWVARMPRVLCHAAPALAAGVATIYVHRVHGVLGDLQPDCIGGAEGSMLHLMRAVDCAGSLRCSAGRCSIKELKGGAVQE